MSSKECAPTFQEAKHCATLAEYLVVSDQKWLDAHPARVVKALAGIEDPGDPITCAIPDVDGRDGLVTNDVACFPWVAARTMPGRSASRYAAFFLKATYAALIAKRPNLQVAFNNGAAMLTTAPVVGIRVGMLSALGMPGNAALGPVSDALYYDPKRSRLWIRAARADEEVEVTLWRKAMDTLPTPDQTCVEIMLAWAHVAPLLACMSSAECYTMGSAYTVPFVQRSISEFFGNHMSKAAYEAARLDRPIVWNSALQAAIHGYPIARVMAWASDPVMAVCAERRVLTDPATIAASRSREAQARKRCASFSRHGSSRVSIPEAGKLWAALRSAGDFHTVLDDDEQSLATAMMVPARDSPGVMPSDSISMVGPNPYVEPPMAPIMPDEVPDHVADGIRRMMQGAHSGDVAARSFGGAAGDDPTVNWA